MNKAITIAEQGQVSVYHQSVPYAKDPTRLFQVLCGSKTNSLLLESAEIDSKENLKSLLLIDAAVRIVCRGHDVEFEALTETKTGFSGNLSLNDKGDRLTELYHFWTVVNNDSEYSWEHTITFSEGTVIEE